MDYYKNSESSFSKYWKMWLWGEVGWVIVLTYNKILYIVYFLLYLYYIMIYYIYQKIKKYLILIKILNI